MTHNSDYKTKCDLCKNKTQSRIYFRKINDKFVWLCKICWENTNAAFLKSNKCN